MQQFSGIKLALSEIETTQGDDSVIFNVLSTGIPCHILISMGHCNTTYYIIFQRDALR
jgi:hypothetical protein